MADERLRLVAEVTDHFTAPLGRMETALRRTGNAAKETAGQVKRDWEPLHGAIGKTTSVLQGMLTPLTALGAGSLTAGLSLTTMATALRNFTTTTRDLSIMSKEVGLTVDQLRGLNRMGDEFGISAERMQGGVRTFAENMSQIRKRYGDAYGALQAMNMGELVEKLVSAPNMKAAMEAAAEEIGKLGDPIRGRKVAEVLLGLPEFRAVASEFKDRFGKVWGETIADIGRIGPETEKAAKDFEKSIGKIGDAAERLKLRILGPMAKGISGLIEDADKNGLGGSAEEQAMKGLVNPGTGPSARDRLEGRRNQVQRQLDLLNQNPAAPDFERKRDRMVEELKRVGDELEKLRAGGASAQQMSFSGPGGNGSLIHRAGFSGVGLPRGPLAGGGGFPVLTDGDGNPVAGPRSSGLPRLPQGPLAGSGSALGGGGAATALGGGSAPANPDAGKRLLDAIARTESGRDGYDTVLGNGRYGRPDKPISEMTLAEARAFGRIVRSRHGSSSALGRYQIVNSTRDLAQRALRLADDTVFNSETQDRMARWIARNQGLGAWEGLKGNPRAMDEARRALGEGGALDARVSSAVSSDTPWFNRPRSNVPGQMSRVRDDEIPVPGSGERPGDAMMRRMYGSGGSREIPGAPMQEHRLTIDFPNAPAGLKATPKMGSLFRDTTVSKTRQLQGSAFA